MDFCETLTDDQAMEIERGLDAQNAGLSMERLPFPVKAGFVDAGRTVGGVVGAAYWGKLHVRLLWVDPDYRSAGLGSRLMDWVERQAEAMGCSAVMVDTMSFQAPEFYRRRGYRQFGLSEGYDGGASRHYFEKRL